MIGAAVLAAVTLLSAQGCAPAPDADADTPASHSVTVAGAEAAYQNYLRVSAAAAARGAEAPALSVASSAQWDQTKSQYLAWALAGTPVPRYRYGTPVFYVPALSGFPQWFVVAVDRTTVTGGKPGATARTLMLFAREKQTDRWTLGGTAVLSRPLPAIARDAEGYAVAVPTTDTSLLLRPDVVGATHAAVVDDGPASPAAAVVAAGPQTTGLHAAQAARAAAERARGLNYEWLLQGASWPQVGLRLAGGGAAGQLGDHHRAPKVAAAGPGQPGQVRGPGSNRGEAGVQHGAPLGGGEQPELAEAREELGVVAGLGGGQAGQQVVQHLPACLGDRVHQPGRPAAFLRLGGPGDRPGFLEPAQRRVERVVVQPEAGAGLHPPPQLVPVAGFFGQVAEDDHVHVRHIVQFDI